jgi:hypothetical protein
VGGAADDEVLAEKAEALADAIEAAVGPWLIGAIRRVAAAQRLAGGDRLVLAAEQAANEAKSEVVPRIRALLADDVDAQATTPLSLLRGAVGPATAVLQSFGAAPADRDEFAVRAFPDDLYDLAPAAFEDVAPELRTPGLEWGAAKAFVHLQRRRADGAA